MTAISQSDTAPTSQGDLPPGTWYHTIDLPDGLVTPGIFDSRPVADLVRWPPGLAGSRCLDVGTCDGFWAFEMERRGAAEVLAVDVDDASALDLTWDARERHARDPAPAGARGRARFEIAHQKLRSRVERLACSVYDLDPIKHGRFGVVFFGTLLLHLRDPIRALERLRDVCAGELVAVECVDPVLDLVGRWVPCARFAPVPGQWWRMNTAGLKSALEVAGFEVLSTSRRFVTPFGPGMKLRGSGWKRPLAALRATVGSWPSFGTLPGLAHATGLLRGGYDVAVLARPRGPRASS